MVSMIFGLVRTLKSSSERVCLSLPSVSSAEGIARLSSVTRNSEGRMSRAQGSRRQKDRGRTFRG
jgi:hypothetical protein